MATSHNFSSDHSAALAGKAECSLLCLPPELRQRIYAIVLGPRRLIDLRHIRYELEPWYQSMIYRPKSEKLHERYGLENNEDVDDESEEKLSESDIEDAYRFGDEYWDEWRTGILEVSKAISNEALDILYGQNVFVLDIHGQGYLKILKFGDANLRRIQYLRIVARPMGVSYGKPLVFDPQLWLPLLEGLQQFCIVAQQPLATRGYYGAPTLEEDLFEWTTWLDPILKFFSINLPKTTAVGLDDDGRAETTAMMDKYFDPGFKRSGPSPEISASSGGNIQGNLGTGIAMVATGATLRTVASATIGPIDMGCADLWKITSYEGLLLHPPHDLFLINQPHSFMLFVKVCE